MLNSSVVVIVDHFLSIVVGDLEFSWCVFFLPYVVDFRSFAGFSSLIEFMGVSTTSTGCLLMIVVLFGVGFFSIRRSWIGSLSSSIYAGIFGTYLLIRGINFRRSLYLFLI